MCASMEVLPKQSALLGLIQPENILRNLRSIFPFTHWNSCDPMGCCQNKERKGMESDQIAELCRACECSQSNWKDIATENHSPIDCAPLCQKFWKSGACKITIFFILPMLCLVHRNLGCTKVTFLARDS